MLAIGVLSLHNCYGDPIQLDQEDELLVNPVLFGPILEPLLEDWSQYHEIAKTVRFENDVLEEKCQELEEKNAKLEKENKTLKCLVWTFAFTTIASTVAGVAYAVSK